MKKGPLVTVCVPTYNNAEYIEESLISILNQNYPNFELFVIDNNSDDDTEIIIRRLKEKYNFTYIKNNENIGAYGNLEKCYSLGIGELIAIYHSDDVYQNSIISESVLKFTKTPELGLVFALMNIMTNSGEITKFTHIPNYLSKINNDFYYLPELFSSLMIDSCFVLTTPTMMMRRNLFFEMGGHELDKFNLATDLGLWLKISEKYPVSIINKPLANYRLTSNQISRNKSISQGSHLKVMRKYLSKYPKYTKYYYKHFCVDVSKRILISCSLNKVDDAKNLSLLLFKTIKDTSVFLSWNKKELVYVFVGMLLSLSLKLSEKLSIKMASLLERQREKRKLAL